MDHYKPLPYIVPVPWKQHWTDAPSLISFHLKFLLLRILYSLLSNLKFLAPSISPWDFPSKNTGVGYHALPQGIFSTQDSNPHLLRLLHCRQADYHWATREALATFIQSFYVMCSKPYFTEMYIQLLSQKPYSKEFTPPFRWTLWYRPALSLKHKYMSITFLLRG